MASLEKRFQCSNCGETIQTPLGTPKPVKCPRCARASYMVHRLDAGSSSGRRGRGGPIWKRTPQ